VAVWPQIRERVARQDRNLNSLLATCKPLAVEGNVIILGFDFAVLREKLDRKRGAAEIIAAALTELLGTQYTIRTVVSEHYSPPAVTTINPDEVAALARELGGIVRQG
jgi:hypothetical protein